MVPLFVGTLPENAHVGISIKKYGWSGRRHRHSIAQSHSAQTRCQTISTRPHRPAGRGHTSPAKSCTAGLRCVAAGGCTWRRARQRCAEQVEADPAEKRLQVECSWEGTHLCSLLPASTSCWCDTRPPGGTALHSAHRSISRTSEKGRCLRILVQGHKHCVKT